ncbi:MAG: ABC transporter permease [Acidobacteriaceae bacterium]|nr:ABC transporter permease [Acidobacteriaceae bacterium]
MLLPKKISLLLPWKRRARERSLDEELRSHVELAATDALEAGATPDEAEFAGRRELGSQLRIREDARNVWGFAALDHFFQDVHFEIRQLKRNPGFTTVVILTLALGAGANALMFTVIDSVLLRPLPYPESHQLVYVDSIQADGSHGSTSLPNFLDMRAQSRSFSAMAAYEEKSVSLRLPSGEPVHSTGVVASANLLDVLRVHPMLGRSFSAEQDQAVKVCSVVLSAEFWREHLSADPRVLGQNLAVDGKACSISGVMPDSFTFPSRDDEFWIPLQPAPDAMNRGASFLHVIARLKSGVTLAVAQTELKVIARRLEKAYPDEDNRMGFGSQLYQDRITENARPALFALLGAVVILLLIACANIANLQLARALGRKREMAIRAALGAGRMRVTGQLFTENIVLALIGTAVGFGLAAGSLGLLKRLAAGAIPRVQEIELRPEIWFAMVMVAGVSALLFGLASVWQSARQDIETALRESAGAVAGGRNQQKIRDLLVVAQLSLAIVLLAGSGLLLRTLYQLLSTDQGFTSEHVLTMQTAVSGTEPADRDLAATVYTPELDEIEHIPGVKAAGFITFLPLSNGSASATFIINGRSNTSRGTQPRALLNAASERFFSALRIPLLEGRFFERTDALGKPCVAIVNDVLARRYFAGQDPIGKQIAFDDPDFKSHPITIIGVVQGTRQTELAKPPDAQLYLDFRQVPPATLWSQFLLKQIMTYVVRSNGNPIALAKEVQHAIHRVDPSQTVFHVAAMTEIVSASVQSRRLGAILLSVFAGLALVVAAAGLYGILSYLVTQRKRDIAVRIALGAQQEEVVRMIVSRALLLYIAGVAAGLVGVIWCGHLLSNMLTGIRPWDPVALGITTSTLLLVSLLAAWFPARRAASIDPYQALRTD